jgi:Leucine-rich repeat (LRR) protein
MTELRSLNIEGTRVADVSPLASLKELRTLAVGGSLVKDTTPLARMTDLEIRE